MRCNQTKRTTNIGIAWLKTATEYFRNDGPVGDSGGGRGEGFCVVNEVNYYPIDVTRLV